MVEISKSPRAIRILLVESHDLTRVGIRVILGETRDPSYDLLEASSVEESKDLLAQSAPVDLVLVGSGQPGHSDMAALSDVLDAAPNTPVALLSADTDTATMREALELGAAGFIPKSLPSPVFRAAISLTLAGGNYFPVQMLLADIANRASAGALGSVGFPGEDMASHGNPADPTRGHVMAEGMGGFSRRQKQVLDLILKGKSNKEIARNLGISLGTAKNYVATILRLRNASSRAQLLSSFVVTPASPQAPRSRIQ